MKKERGFIGLGLLLVMNYMMHQMFAPAIYFGVVLCGLLVFYGKVNSEKMMKQGIVRFSFILLVCFITDVSIGFLSSIGWFVVCVLNAAVSQRMMKSSYSFLENISMINMIVLCFVFCGVLLQMMSPMALVMVIALIQPSGLPLEIEGIRFLNVKTDLK